MSDEQFTQAFEERDAAEGRLAAIREDYRFKLEAGHRYTTLDVVEIDKLLIELQDRRAASPVQADVERLIQRLQYVIDDGGASEHGRIVGVCRDAIAALSASSPPSAATKAAYIGEFKFEIEEWNPDDDSMQVRQMAVPWTSVKEIMAAIKARALAEDGPPTKEGVGTGSQPTRRER